MRQEKRSKDWTGLQLSNLSFKYLNLEVHRFWRRQHRDIDEDLGVIREHGNWNGNFDIVLMENRFTCSQCIYDGMQNKIKNKKNKCLLLFRWLINSLARACKTWKNKRQRAIDFRFVWLSIRRRRRFIQIGRGCFWLFVSAAIATRGLCAVLMYVDPNDLAGERSFIKPQQWPTTSFLRNRQPCAKK